VKTGPIRLSDLRALLEFHSRHARYRPLGGLRRAGSGHSDPGWRRSHYVARFPRSRTAGNASGLRGRGRRSSAAGGEWRRFLNRYSLSRRMGRRSSSIRPACGRPADSVFALMATPRLRARTVLGRNTLLQPETHIPAIGRTAVQGQTPEPEGSA
jgi:hypothetical protein